MKNNSDDNKKNSESTSLTVGIVMPISAIDGCTAEHWSDVKSIITEAVDSIETPKFEAKLVSEANDVGIIHNRIIAGVYSSDIVVCDVSGKNPNVMFELGMRLAFDKPVVIIKDERTDYSFDTSAIEHLTYPRDLRFHPITVFKTTLAAKILATHNSHKNNPEASFLKTFGTIFKVQNLNEREAAPYEVLMAAVEETRRDVQTLAGKIATNQPEKTTAIRYYSTQSKIEHALKNVLERASPTSLMSMQKDPRQTIELILSQNPELQKEYDNGTLAVVIGNAIKDLKKNDKF